MTENDKKNAEILTGHWTFNDNDLARSFNAHIRNHLPWYDMTTKLVADLVAAFVPYSGTVVDIGAANGNIARALAPLITARSLDMVSIEAAPEMVETFDGPGEVIEGDVECIDLPRCDVVVSMLALMFLPIDERARVIKRIMDAIVPGGAFIAVEKFTLPDGQVGECFVRMAMSLKQWAGLDLAEIAAKELTLLGAQRALYENEIPYATQFFQVGQFRGVVWTK